ncbi:ABC-type Na+ efflux pump permease component-like protein [Novosphingobium nitrogenifigens DSM 19370]|uniref:ABC-type Na+ efflux pump permease component-like protein n=1 Tax=Novosphingobium nitrogenifigens DSM 19370 TaxID=983920 RepID=F1Z4F1_9SPHN|nr:ABC transporter permease [Novosphingobium nitrogenifigens]EGD60561.1 ABC-type Na+ efflux pump permease component-like protein [Novosphingobium nitrogenifigens DSM 19370]
MLSHRLQAAWVVARRDFVAVVFSKAFIFFLLGPLFPIVVGFFAGAIGASVQQNLDRVVVGVAMPDGQGDLLVKARDALAGHMEGGAPDFVVLDRLHPGDRFDARRILKDKRLAAVVTGTLDAPVLTATRERIDDWNGMVALFAARAKTGEPAVFPPVRGDVVATSAAREHSGQVLTAQAGQVLLFLLTMLLAGMVLSNLVEEKANKIIEVLAASIPMDALFLGKLFAMLAVSIVGIAVWGAGYGVMVLAGLRSIPLLAAPAVGWPLFLVLGFLYFAMAYLLLGAMFLAIGGMANTVREVQTLSMPATMLQLIVFFFASFALARPGTWLERAAEIFPVSSPYAMLARAAQHAALLPHLGALCWQALWVAVIVRGGALLFRRTVMKSGPAPRRRRASAV